MAIFTAISMWATAALGAGWSLLGLSPAMTSALFSVGRAVSWSLASQALARQSVPAQKVQAIITQTDSPRVRAYGRVLLGGPKAFFEAQDGTLHQIVVIHHGAVDGLIRFWVDGEPVTLDADNKVHRYMRLLFRDGSGPVSGDYPEVLSRFPGLWTSQHRLQWQATFNTAFGDPADEDFVGYFPKGTQTMVQAEVRASRVRDMLGAMVYSENAALCIRDYLIHPDGWRIPAASIDDDSFGRFAVICGQAVPLLAGGTEPRYRLCGHYALDDAPKDVAARMLATCDGQVHQTPEGKVGILGGAWSEPDVTITADDILELSVEDGFDPFTDFNILKGTFTSPAHSYQPIEVPDIRHEADLAMQGERVEQIEIDMCPSGSQMQRLMKIIAAKRRRDMTGTLTTNLVGLKARFPKGDGIHTIRVRAPDFGLDGVFEVTSHRFSVPDGWCEIGIASLANPYPWTASMERPIPTATGELPKPVKVIPPPSGASLTQVHVRISGDTYGGKLRLTVNSVSRNDLTLQAQVAVGNVAADAAGSVTWTAMSGDRFSAETGILQNEQTYTVRYRWRGQGNWQKAGAVTIVANPNVPSAPTGFARVGTTGAQFQWRNPPDNFWKARLFRSSSPTFAGASYVDDIAGLPGQVSAYTDTPPAGTWHYWVVALNGSSVASPPAGPLTITI